MVGENKKEEEVFGEDFDLLEDGLEDILSLSQPEQPAEETAEEIDETTTEEEEEDTLEDNNLEIGEDAEESDEATKKLFFSINSIC